MGDLKVATTSYPSQLDTATLIADVTDDIVAEHVNNPVAAILAIETELGVDVAGSVTDLATRLGVNIHADGGVLRGTSFPVSPPLKPHLFYRTDTDTWHSYNIGTAQYETVATTTALSGYLRKDVDETVTAQHTFNPTSAKPPFVLGANAVDQKVIGLNADKLDGYNPANTTGAIPISNTTVNTDLNADLVDGIHASATATASMLFPLGANKNLALPTPTSGTHTINGVEIATVNSNVASATYASNITSVAGVTILTAAADTERTDTYRDDTYRLIKKITMVYTGTYTTYFEIKTSAANFIRAKIYKNGSPVGTERAGSTVGYIAYTEDFSLSAGDTVELWTKTDSSVTGYCRYFRVYSGAMGNTVTTD